MDWFSVGSIGTYPAVASTDAQRASYAVSYGLFGTAPDFSSALAGMYHGLLGVGMGLVMR